MIFENRFKTSLFYSILVHVLIIVVLAFTGVFTIPKIQDKIVEISLLEPMGGHSGGAVVEQIEEVQQEQEQEPEPIVEKKKRIIKPKFKPKVIKKVVQKVAKIPKKASGVMTGKVVDNPGNGEDVGTGNGKEIGLGDGKGTGIGSGMGIAVQPPKIIKHKTPRYPFAAKRDGIEGVTRVKILIDSAGKVEDIIIAESSGSKLLDDAAIKAVKKWRFIPAKNKAGHVIRCYASMPIVFRIKK